MFEELLINNICMLSAASYFYTMESNVYSHINLHIKNATLSLFLK